MIIRRGKLRELRRTKSFSEKNYLQQFDLVFPKQNFLWLSKVGGC